MSLARDCDPPRVPEMPEILIQGDFPCALENRRGGPLTA